MGAPELVHLHRLLRSVHVVQKGEIDQATEQKVAEGCGPMGTGVELQGTSRGRFETRDQPPPIYGKPFIEKQVGEEAEHDTNGQQPTQGAIRAAIGQINRQTRY